MYDFCDNDSELAAILSHEIAHNELRHITKMVKKKKAGLQEIDIIFKNTIGGAFSQHDEAQCDLFGTISLLGPSGPVLIKFHK